MAEKTDIVALAAEAKLRREDLYQDACVLCSTHVRPEALFSHAIVKRWLGPFSSWKDERPAFHHPCPVADPGKRVWQALRRWAQGSAADFNVVDRFFASLGYAIGPDDFEGAWLRRVSFPWDEQAYATRVAYVFALNNMRRVMEGLPPYTDASAQAQAGKHEDLPLPLARDLSQGASCPCCGGWGAAVSGGSVSADQRHAASRRRKRALRRAGSVHAFACQPGEQLALFGGAR